MGELTKAGQSLRERWNNLNLRQKITLLLSAGLLLATLGVVLAYAGQPDYSPLFTNLSPDDAAAIAQKLSDKKIPYKPSADGSAILVPTKQVYQARWAMAAEGLPKGGGVGFEIFDKTNIGATDFDRRVSYTRAVQGELERTFRQMPEVDNARVMIVLPEQDPFALSDKKAARASVFLQLKPGMELDPKQVRGVIQLVSHSVDNLQPEDVTVTDVHGRILNPPDIADSSGSVDAAASAQLQQQKAFQLELQQSLQTLLEQVLGPGNVATRVVAELNFDTKTQDKQLFQPLANGAGILRSMQRVEKSFSSTQPSGAPVGTDPNQPVPPTYQSAAGDGTSKSDELSVTNNYEISEVREHIQVAPGSVKRLSVAVVVNPPKDRPFGDDQKKAIHDMVAAAIGVDASRNDQISVTALPFDNTVATAIQKEFEQSKVARAAQTRMIWIGAGSALALLLLFLLLRRRSRIPQPALAGFPGPAGVPGTVVAPGSAAERAASAYTPEGAALLAALARNKVKEPTPEELERQRVREEVEKLAQTKPEDVAALIKTWLNDD